MSKKDLIKYLKTHYNVDHPSKLDDKEYAETFAGISGKGFDFHKKNIYNNEVPDYKWFDNLKDSRMTKKAILQKVAKHEVAKFTTLGIGVGAIPGLVDYGQSFAAKDVKYKDILRKRALKRLSVGIPVGGSLGYGFGKGVHLLNEGAEMASNINEAAKKVKAIDTETINEGIKNTSEGIKRLDEKIQSLEPGFLGKLIAKFKKSKND